MDTLAPSAQDAAGAGDHAPLVLSLDALNRSSLSLVGGKGANLGELRRAGFPAPPGCCVTAAAYSAVAEAAGLPPLLEEIAGADDLDRVAALAAAARSRLLVAPVPDALVAAIEAAYRALGSDGAAPVAVRSSATAEDLPEASFAGQQDSYLNVVGVEALLDAVRRCWASLWTERAAVYRATNGIDQRAVRLAVVIQRMVDAAVAGIMFTANPVTGRRGQVVIDASPGLGEAVVSGAVDPDHLVVDAASGEVVERRLGAKETAVRPRAGGGTERVALAGRGEAACLADAEIGALVLLGGRVEAHYGAPQDIEWAIARDGSIWLTQARPITTLFPLPVRTGGAPGDGDLHVYLSINVAQGVYRPFTPMGLQGLRLFGSSVAAALGLPPRDPLDGPAILVEAAGRLFVDLTPALRSRPGRAALLFALSRMEARSAAALRALVDDRRLATRPTRPARLAAALIRGAATTRLPVRVGLALLAPALARRRTARLVAEALAGRDSPSPLGAAERLAVVERLLLMDARRLLSGAMGSLLAGMLAWRLAGMLLGDLATPTDRDAVLRGLPHNPTTEMDLALWALAQRMRDDGRAAMVLHSIDPARLAAAYRAGALPPALQRGLAGFLGAYGHRGVAEIDLGLPRWSEDPTHLLGALANYLRLDEPAAAPDAQFRAATRAGEAMAARLRTRARRHGRLRAIMIRWALHRARALMGLRETPKFTMVALLARARALLWPVGQELAASGRLEAAGDVFYLTLAEAGRALAGSDLRGLIAVRRAAYARELRRRHVPRLLLSDGADLEATLPSSPAEGALRGTPASAGVVTAPARVILDPAGARLEPGEVLVAPSTDPGWTPLFLTAGGLVMEMGGPMSHGAVVAREYGIPAVVGVAGATARIQSGAQITVDGAAGAVYLAPGTP